MSVSRSLLFLLFAAVPATATAGVMPEDLPPGTVWYLHADIAQMKSTESGGDLFEWLDDEVFVEIYEETGINVGSEVDTITAFSGSPKGTIFLIYGQIKKETQDKVIALARADADVEELNYKRKRYYLINDDDDDGHHRRGRGKDVMEDMHDGAYVSFALKNKVIITGREEQMKELLDNNGRVAGAESHKGALFVLTADKTFVQAGVDTDSFADDDDDWDSRIFRNTEQAALMISDMDGMIAIEAQLVSTEPKLAQSIGGIATGLISLQSFNEDLDPQVKNLLANTKVKVDGSVLSIAMVVPPDLVVQVLVD